MDDLALFFKSFTPGAWGIWTGVALFMYYMGKQYIEERKLSAADRAARREGYEKQIQMLTAENRAVMEMQGKLREEYDKYREICHKETDELREQSIRLENTVQGLRRRIDTIGLVIARSIDIDPEVVKRVEEAMKGYNDDR